MPKFDLLPMEAKLVSELPDDGSWQFEPKWDGFRELVFRAGSDVEIMSKSGKPLSRYFPKSSSCFETWKFGSPAGC